MKMFSCSSLSYIFKYSRSEWRRTFKEEESVRRDILLLLTWRMKVEFLLTTEYLIFQWAETRPINTFFSLDIYGLFYILSLWTFLSKERVCLTPKEDNVISEICYLASRESPDLIYQPGYLLTSSKCPAVISALCSCLHLGKYIVYSNVTMAE